MKRLLLSLICMFAAGIAHSAVHFSTVGWEGYTNGNLAGQHGWTESSFGNSTHVEVLNGSIVWGDDSELAYLDVPKTLGTGETLFYAMKLKITGGNGVHTFAGFKNTGSVTQTAVAGLDFIGPDDYRIGLTNATSLSVGWDNPVAGQQYAQEYLLVAGYDYDSGVSTLWLDPTSSSSTSISTGAAFSSERPLNQFILKGGSGALSVHSVSALSVADSFNEAVAAVAVPEPHSTLMLAVGVLCTCLVRRK